MTAQYRVQRLRLPSSVQGDDAREFREFSDLTDAVERQIWGHDDRCSPADFRLGVWRDTRYELTSLFFVRDGERMVGRAWCQLPLKEDLTRATVRAEVLDAYAGRGIGRLLLAAATEEATRHGRSVLSSFTEHPAGFDAGAPDAVVPSTGTGALPAAARSVAFALAAGFQLSQVERFSELLLAEHDAGWPALEAAAAAAGADYEVLVWEGVPREGREEMAGLLSRMSTDIPYGVDRYEAATWDATRVEALEEQLADAGTLPLYAVARHRASGRLVAYTALWIRAAKAEIADQDDTLVVAEHRGHSLGMLIKLANLRAYRERFPEARKVITFNAEENRHMLAINEALGFRPAGYDGEWYRRLA
ncbi:GNAT family N-acetyltransferase [Sinomonas sp. ASV322]|uniref:GNAT family N-acetyltransferase n=1 Tax=Sinomonas sp. ASV322 TaxID=3041920 RepID=UPI0027DCF64B|nr:GNAT family N-acetyltransferase [Sinomonas sp. ASV322]MDQ4501809.1 GNAT family N-acetyltransferase [Sinomonas sp. ASV322]